MIHGAQRRKNTVRLLVEPPVEKAWAAVTAVSQLLRKEWVSIDEVGDFIQKRQLDAAAVQYAVKDPNTRYALRPGVLKHQKGWEAHDIVHALSLAASRSVVDHQRREDGNFFRPIPKANHAQWSVENDSVPLDPKWSGTH